MLHDVINLAPIVDPRVHDTGISKVTLLNEDMEESQVPKTSNTVSQADELLL